RTILFCDLERPLKYRWAARFNRWFSRVVMTAAASPNQEGDQVGLVSRLFRISWVVGQYRRHLKRWNKTVYHVVRAALIIGVIALIIFIYNLGSGPAPRHCSRPGCGTTTVMCPPEC